MGSALTSFIAALIVFGLIHLFSKSKKRKKYEALKNPKDAENNLRIAINLFNEKKSDEALVFFNNIDRNINEECTVFADHFKGHIFVEKLEFVKARECFEFVISRKDILSAENVIDILSLDYYTLGGIYFMNSEFNLAKEFKEKAITINHSLINVDMKAFPGFVNL